MVVVQDTDHGVLRGLVVLHWLTLTQHTDGPSPLPCAFVQASIKANRLGRPQSDRYRRGTATLITLLGCRSDHPTSHRNQHHNARRPGHRVVNSQRASCMTIERSSNAITESAFVHRPTFPASLKV